MYVNHPSFPSYFTDNSAAQQSLLQTQLECLNIRNWQLQQVLFAQLQSHLRVLTPEVSSQQCQIDEKWLSQPKREMFDGKIIPTVYFWRISNFICVWTGNGICGSTHFGNERRDKAAQRPARLPPTSAGL